MTDQEQRKILTVAEWEAVEVALNQCLAGPLDGFDEGSAKERCSIRAMQRALAKVQHNLLLIDKARGQ